MDGFYLHHPGEKQKDQLSFSIFINCLCQTLRGEMN